MLSRAKASPEPQPDSTYRDVLYAERLRNARRGTMLRAAIVSGFFGTEMFMAYGLRLYEWHQGTTVLGGYCAASVLIWLFARNSDRLTLAASMAIPILDMPAMFLVFVRTLPVRDPVRRERLRRYFSPDVAGWVEERGDDDPADTRVITVLFCDIRGFTELTQDMSPRRVVDLLKEYQNAMVDEIFDNGGTLDKFIGDGILAYFNAPQHQPDHAPRALHCALSMCTALDGLNESRAKRAEPRLEIGIGIHTGPAMLGTVGTDQRREYTAIGSTVNVAAHLEELTREVDGPILLTESTHQLIGASTGAELLPKTRIRGVSEPISVYRCAP